MDPQTANLWAAFEQARNFSRSPRSQDAKTVEPDEVVANGSAVPAEPSAPTTKQKRPNASRKRKGSEEIEVPRKETRVRSNSIVVKQDTSQTGFLSSLLKNIKDSSTDQGPALSSPRHTIPSSIHRQRQYSPPLSPSNAGSSAGSDHTQSRPQSPTDPECESRPSSPVVRYNKTDLSRLVSSQLKPLYHVKLTKDEFTTINRTVTRRLFDDPLVCVESEAGLRTRIAREIRHELDEILIPID
ncbi:putative PHD and RING finger domain protein [Taphrina deformans PYCC 5710]|uniref:PHD and RING finger domain protein n=1 Tax=Taphrina deformans (strain PYCC 5710 / ATCC 11124 / CBS 356.35 / IMI 108563 / JCM 9778 / NBRC 8474) TaxID=1097556 RepID=R4XD20_TAPDE|nr:putative PHD and RING finger domain protein [Taphrina deformans PYCC 5710]|eukprot:CCG83503.1 putative PHD and RING finger domain protein [Taphrina deformans PYCC 5710]